MHEVPGFRSLRPALLLLPLGLLAWLALLGMVLTHQGLAEDDRPVLHWLVGHRSGSWSAAMEGVSSTGAVAFLTVAVGVAALVLTLRQRSVRPLATVGLAVVGAGITGEVLKFLVARSRPPVATMLGSAETGYGFPSNHTLATSALIGALALVVWQATTRGSVRAVAVTGAVVIAGVMGASRLYLGDHWLTDVLASYTLAVAVLAAVAWSAARFGATWDRWAQPALRRLPRGA